MEYEEIKKYFDKYVNVYCIDGIVLDGYITNTVSEFDTPSGKEEIDLMSTPSSYGIPFDEIEKIEIIGN